MPKNAQEPYVNGQLVTDPEILEGRIQDLKRLAGDPNNTRHKNERLAIRLKLREQQLEALLERGKALSDLAKSDTENDLI